MEKNPKSVAREYAFCFLYGFETGWNSTSKEELKDSNFRILEKAVVEFETSVTQADSEIKLDKLNVASQSYCRTLLKGILEQEEKLQELLLKYLKVPSIKKISGIDRSVLMLAAYELINIADTPKKVVISEALSLASKYGGDGSSSFVNGMLDKMLKDIK
jgi:transcription antitermination protein NusB